MTHHSAFAYIEFPSFFINCLIEEGGNNINLIREDFIMGKIKGWIAELTEITVALVALGVAAGVVFGADVPFVGAVLGNVVDLINQLGDAGVVGIIVLAILSGMYGSRGM